MTKKTPDATIKTTEGFVPVEYKVGQIIDYNKKKMKVVEVNEDNILVKALEFPFESFPIFTRVKAND